MLIWFLAQDEQHEIPQFLRMLATQAMNCSLNRPKKRVVWI